MVNRSLGKNFRYHWRAIPNVREQQATGIGSETNSNMGETAGKKEEDKNMGDHGQFRKRRPSAYIKNKEWKDTPTRKSTTHRTGKEKLKVKID